MTDAAALDFGTNSHIQKNCHLSKSCHFLEIVSDFTMLQMSKVI